jgi:UDPglucose 6-dehydrogenase
MPNITVVGAGYVGLSNALMMARRFPTVLLEVDSDKVDLINAGKSPIQDAEMDLCLGSENLDLRATLDTAEALGTADWVIVATPTDYNSATDSFDVSSVESVVHAVSQCRPLARIVIRSTLPVGCSQRLCEQYPSLCLIYAPEFLREGSALHDCLYPGRIVVGGDSSGAAEFAELLKSVCLNPNAEVFLTPTAEAEAIKLFSNTYLAMRVAFFNELDSYALSRQLDSRQIIAGVCSDPRIGTHYNNPSFGYGGYCLPKDTRQLLANYEQIPQNLMRAVVDANETRKRFVAADVLKKKPRCVGIHRLAMKVGSDNFRDSSILGVLNLIQESGVPVVIYEPALADGSFMGCEVIQSLSDFKWRADLIIANRMSEELRDVQDRVYTRDLFGSS